MVNGSVVKYKNKGKIMASYLKAVALCGLLALAPSQAMAAVVTFDSIDQGWYNSLGQHTPSNRNTYTGTSGSTQHRGWFAFDIAGAKQAASISITFLTNGQLRTNAGEETVGLYDYTGSVPKLLNGTGGIATYADLGSGALLGQHTIKAVNSTSMPQFTVELSSDFVSQFNAVRQSADPRIALGAALLSIQKIGTEAFWAGSGRFPAAFLTVREVEPKPNRVPEPAGFALLGAGLLGLSFTALWRKKR